MRFSHDEKLRAMQSANEDGNRKDRLTETGLYAIAFILLIAIFWP